MKVFLVFFALLFSVTANAQSRSLIKQGIALWGECRNVAITKYNGDLAIYGANGMARADLPKKLMEALDELNEEHEFISDVQWFATRSCLLKGLSL